MMQRSISFRINKNTAIQKRQEAESRHSAILLFADAKKRLLDINHWHLLYEQQVERFTLCDENGHLSANETPAVGDLICVEQVNSEGKDWFRIEQFISEKNLLKDEEQFGFTVKSVAAPDAQATQHLKNDTVIIFLIVRNANVVVAMEKVKEVRRSALRRIFRAVVSTVSRVVSVFGIRSHQWESLVQGIITGPGHRWDKKVI
jgi:hypothetical protein